MRHSIKLKFFAAFTAVALVFIALISVLNLFFYDDFYMMERRSDLRDLYRETAVDYDGTLYRILEMYGCTQTPDEGVKWSPEEQFKRISEFEREHPWLKGRKIVDSIADPAIWDSSRGESIADTAAQYGIYFSPGDHERIPGWMQVHYRFQFDENGYPRMYIFNTCKAFIRTIPLMMFSETRPEDLDTKLEDHCPDEVRYMCMSRPIKPIIHEERKAIISDPLNQFSEKQHRRGYI